MVNSEIEKDLAYLHQNMDRLNQTWRAEDPPVQSRVPVIGGLITLFKRLIRKSVYWLLRPYWDRQSAFNNTVACAVSDLYRLECALAKRAAGAGEAADPMREETGPRIIQLVSSLNFGDAVGNEVISFKKALQENGFATEIYANEIHRKIPAGTARLYRDMPQLRVDDLVIYHFASECPISRDIKNFPCRVVLRYHNVTPPVFFHGFDENAERATANGLRQVQEIRPYIDSCLPVSEFNKQDLEKMGYTCPMQVLPILIRFEDYEQEPDKNVIEKYSDGITNILFVGRIAPNKKIEDVISGFAYYKKYCNPLARLFLVGAFQETDRYYQFLRRHIQKLDVENIVFSGHISFQEILAYYTLADVFLCMSEHEGFCVPLVEAMLFKVPILAYDSSAISSTLGKSAVLITKKEPAAVANAIEATLGNASAIKAKESERLKNFSRDRVTHQFINYIKESM